MDVLVITSIVTSFGSLALSLITHLKYSECCGSKMVFKSKLNTPVSSPEVGETTTFFQNQPRPITSPYAGVSTS